MFSDENNVHRNEFGEVELHLGVNTIEPKLDEKTGITSAYGGYKFYGYNESDLYKDYVPEKDRQFIWEVEIPQDASVNMCYPHPHSGEELEVYNFWLTNKVILISKRDIVDLDPENEVDRSIIMFAFETALIRNEFDRVKLLAKYINAKQVPYHILISNVDQLKFIVELFKGTDFNFDTMLTMMYQDNKVTPEILDVLYDYHVCGEIKISINGHWNIVTCLRLDLLKWFGEHSSKRIANGVNWYESDKARYQLRDVTNLEFLDYWWTNRDIFGFNLSFGVLSALSDPGMEKVHNWWLDRVIKDGVHYDLKDFIDVSVNGSQYERVKSIYESFISKTNEQADVTDTVDYNSSFNRVGALDCLYSISNKTSMPNGINFTFTRQAIAPGATPQLIQWWKDHSIEAIGDKGFDISILTFPEV